MTITPQNNNSFENNMASTGIPYIISWLFRTCQATNPKVNINNNLKTKANWFEELEETNSRFFDNTASLDFINNYAGSGVFSPVSCETVFLMNAIKEEAEFETRLFIERYIAKITSKLACTNRKNEIKMPIKTYIPEEDMGILYVKTRTCTATVCNRDDIKESTVDHSKWAKDMLQKEIKTSSKGKYFVKGFKVYTASAYFQENLGQGIEFKKDKKDTFMSENGKIVERRYINFYDCYVKHDMFEKDGIKYEIIAIPCIEKGCSPIINRYMFYIVPRCKNTVNLGKAWEDFNKHAGNNIRKYILDTAFSFGNLQIPKIGDLESKINFETVLPTVYSKIKTKTLTIALRVKLEGFIETNKENPSSTFQESIVNPHCISKLFKVDVPHVAFVYHTISNRIMLVIKDVGPKNN
ncbi:hypothetical protein PAEPH01_0755 [Pancytospora epiphaga]|nr:hypothetical protein PAEPH01_0755 [Pancytospora epiphaga]